MQLRYVCKPWRANDELSLLLVLMRWYFSCRGKLSKLVADHVLRDLYTRHTLVAIVHKEHTLEKVRQNHACSAMGLNDGWSWCTLKAGLTPPLGMLSSHGYDVLQQLDCHERPLPS